MLGLWLEGGALRLREDLPRPRSTSNEALVRVLCAGICNTDLEMMQGYYPFTGILGHEFVGVVEEGPGSLIGRRVVGEINTCCGECPSCERGLLTHCERRTVLGLKNRNGAFAEYLTLPVENLHPLPSEIPNHEAVFTEPLAAALQIQSQVPVSGDDRVLVVGDGKLGQLVAQTLAMTGCNLEVVGRRALNRPVLTARGIPTRGAEEIPPGTFDIAVDCSGSPSGLDLALRALRARGVLVLKSTFTEPVEFDQSRLVVQELTVVGSRCGPFPPAIQLLREKQVEVGSLIDARYALAQGLAAIEHAGRPGTLKILLDVAGRE